MNDFTNRELELINYILKRHDFRERELINKLKSMIDNYCDHKETNWDDGINYCNKCGMCVL